ncbi:MAG: hypothetical protein ACOC2C_05695 [Cyclonatronaceae bacterium]
MSKQQKQPSAMADNDAFKQRREALEAELHQIESKLENSVETFRTDVQSRLRQLRPAYWIRKFPAYSISLALFAGYVLAPKSSKAGRSQAQPSESAGDPPPPLPPAAPAPSWSASSVVAAEIKRMLTRKVTTFIVDKLEELVDEQFAGKQNKKPEA